MQQLLKAHQLPATLAPSVARKWHLFGKSFGDLPEEILKSYLEEHCEEFSAHCLLPEIEGMLEAFPYDGVTLVSNAQQPRQG